MIDEAKLAGCKFVKFQLWDPKNLKKAHGIVMVDARYTINHI